MFKQLKIEEKKREEIPEEDKSSDEGPPDSGSDSDPLEDELTGNE